MIAVTPVCWAAYRRAKAELQMLFICTSPGRPVSLFEESAAFFPASDRPELRVPSVCLSQDIPNPMPKRSNPADTAQESVHQIMLCEDVPLGVKDFGSGPNE